MIPGNDSDERNTRAESLDVEVAGHGIGGPDSSFRALFESAPDAIFVEDLSGRVLDVNPAGCLLHGMTKSELIGLSVEDLVPPENREKALEHFNRLVSGELQRVEGFSYTKDGESVPVSVRVRRFEYRGEPAMLFHVTDLTEQRSLERQLLQSQKMEAIGHMAGGVAHDFNNLLTAILGFTELCMSSLGEEHELHADLVEVQKAGKQGARLTRQLLAYSRQQVLTPRVLDLNEVVEKVEKLLRRTIGEDIRMTTRLSAELHKVKVDESQLVQVILNLVLNSRDAMPVGGDIVIETLNLSLQRDSPRRGFVVPAGEYVSLALVDTGQGMSTDVCDRAFDPFFTTKETGKGTGLGLSTVYGIVKQSGGFIWLDSIVGRGTTVQVLLPSAGRTSQKAQPQPTTVPVQADDQTILLTEDNPVIRRLAQRVLEESGYRVLAAGSAEDALRFSAERREKIHLLVTDLVLTGEDGLSLARKVIECRPGTRVLLMSGHSREARFNPAALLDGIPFLQKPFTPDGLRAAVADALQESAVRIP